MTAKWVQLPTLKEGGGQTWGLRAIRDGEILGVHEQPGEQRVGPRDEGTDEEEHRPHHERRRPNPRRVARQRRIPPTLQAKTVDVLFFCNGLCVRGCTCIRMCVCECVRICVWCVVCVRAVPCVCAYKHSHEI